MDIRFPVLPNLVGLRGFRNRHLTREHLLDPELRLGCAK
jgi:hypothetical protein